MLKSQKATCAGIVASYSCGNHDGTPTYSGATIPVKAGDELAMNSLLLTIVEIDGGGNGIGKIKMPIMNGAYLGLKLSGIQAVEGGCIVGGRAEIAGDVPVVFLDAKLKENLQTLAAGLELTASAGQHYAKEIAAGIDHLKDAINNLKNKKENTRKLLEATDVNGNINPAIESCVEISQIATSLQDSLQSVYCNDKIKGVNKNDLKKALDANRDFMNKLGPALAECQNTQFTSWTEQPCKGPCGDFEVYTVSPECAKKLQDAFDVDFSKYVHDFTSKITLEDLKQFDGEVNTDSKSKYKKNLCGEYLMYDDVLTNLGGTGSIFIKVPPKDKKAISSFFNSDIEYYQYLVLRTLYSDKVGCKQFVLGQDVYLDEKFIKMREKLLMFLGSGFSTMNIGAVKKGITNNEEWNGFKQMVITDLFDDSKSQNIQVEWIEYVDNAVKFRTLGEITAGITLDLYIGFSPFVGHVIRTISKSNRLSKFAKLIAEGKTGQTLTFWTRRIEFKGINVYQRDSYIDPLFKSDWVKNGKKKFGTNVERMADGLAPISPDGKTSVNLHHLIQSDKAGLVEIAEDFHKKYHTILHINPSSIPSGINRAEFTKFRGDYWIKRSLDFK